MIREMHKMILLWFFVFIIIIIITSVIVCITLGSACVSQVESG